MGLKGGGEGGAVAAPVHRQGAAGGHRVLVGGADHQGAEPPELLLKQPGGPVAAEGPKAVAADQLGKLAAVVSRGAAHRPHLDKPHPHTCFSHLPSRLGARQAGPNHQHFRLCTTRWLSGVRDCSEHGLVPHWGLDGHCGEISRGTHHTGQAQEFSR